jgi:putative endonuclease
VKREIGNLAEEKIRGLLEKEGYETLAKNFYAKNGEIDIIAKKGDTIVFFEVKYRSSSKFGYGEESVDSKKRKRIYLSAMEYLNQNGLRDYNYRFDVVSLMGEEVTWIKNSIWGDEIGF